METIAPSSRPKARAHAMSSVGRIRGIARLLRIEPHEHTLVAGALGQTTEDDFKFLANVAHG